MIDFEMLRRLVTYQVSVLLPQLYKSDSIDLRPVSVMTPDELTQMHAVCRHVIEHGGMLTARLDEVEKFVALYNAAQRRMLQQDARKQ